MQCTLSPRTSLDKSINGTNGYVEYKLRVETFVCELFWSFISPCVGQVENRQRS